MTVMSRTARRSVRSELVREGWADHAACAGTPTGVFYPEHTGSQQRVAEQRAKQVCAGCPVRAECLSWALRTDEPWGVWGGMGPNERRRLRGAS